MARVHNQAGEGAPVWEKSPINEFSQAGPRMHCTIHECTLKLHSRTKVAVHIQPTPLPHTVCTLHRQATRSILFITSVFELQCLGCCTQMRQGTSLTFNVIEAACNRSRRNEFSRVQYLCGLQMHCVLCYMCIYLSRPAYVCIFYRGSLKVWICVVVDPNV